MKRKELMADSEEKKEVQANEPGVMKSAQLHKMAIDKIVEQDAGQILIQAFIANGYEEGYFEKVTGSISNIEFKHDGSIHVTIEDIKVFSTDNEVSNPESIDRVTVVLDGNDVKGTW